MPFPSIQKLVNHTLLCTLMLAGAAWSQSSSGKRQSRNTVNSTKRWVLINNRSLESRTSGSNAQTAEAVKTFRERCPEVGVTLDPRKADFRVLIGHNGHKSLWRRDNKIAVFDRSGNAIFSTSTRTLGNAVKDACEAIIPYSEEHGSAAVTGSGH